MGEIINKTKGRIKQAVGSLTGDAALKREGARDENRGRLEGAADDLKHAAKTAARDAKHAINKVSK